MTAAAGVPGDILSRAAEETLQRLCGLTARPAGAGDGPADAAAEVQFWGAMRGKLMAQARGGLGREAALRLFGGRAPASRQQQEALCLLVAAVCGAMLADAAAGRAYLMESPRIVDNIAGYEQLFGRPLAAATLATAAGTLEVRYYANVMPATGIQHEF